MSVIKIEGQPKMTEPEYQAVAHGDEVHSVSAKMTPHCQTFAILMSLHGNSLLLNQKNYDG